MYRIPLTDDQRAAYLTMPTNRDGHVVALAFVPPGQVAEYEARWRDWCARTPKHLWPDWIGRWKDVKRLRGLS